MRRLTAPLALALLIVAAAAWTRWPGGPLPSGTRADRVVIDKSDRALTLYARQHPVRTYQIALGRAPVGPKRQEGDGRTPEGLYRIDGRLRTSDFHLALHVSYPNSDDQAAAGRLGVNPGGAIMIHGIRNGLGWMGRAHRLVDWTSGCIAVTDWEIEEIWDAVPDGTPVEIRP